MLGMRTNGRDVFTSIKWLIFQLTEVVLFLLAAYKMIRAAILDL
jgi:hypothetical protein